MTAKEKGESPINWAITGLIGYWITWWVVKLTLVSSLMGMVAKNPTGAFLIYQIPALCGIGAAFFIRKKLLANAAEKNN
ncbi:MAG: hypothetical protein ACU83U_12375 [Gammaproteobacteria bacterium]